MPKTLLLLIATPSFIKHQHLVSYLSTEEETFVKSIYYYTPPEPRLKSCLGKFIWGNMKSRHKFMNPPGDQTQSFWPCSCSCCLFNLCKIITAICYCPPPPLICIYIVLKLYHLSCLEFYGMSVNPVPHISKFLFCLGFNVDWNILWHMASLPWALSL